MNFLYAIIFLFVNYFSASYQALTSENRDFFYRHCFELVSPLSTYLKTYNFENLKKIKQFHFIKSDDVWEGVINYLDDDDIASDPRFRIGFFKAHVNRNYDNDFLLVCECESSICCYCSEFKKKFEDRIVYCGKSAALDWKSGKNPLLLRYDALGNFQQEKLLIKGFEPSYIAYDNFKITFKDKWKLLLTYDCKTKKISSVKIDDAVITLGNKKFYCGNLCFIEHSENGEVIFQEYSNQNILEKSVLLFKGLQEKIMNVTITDHNKNIKFFLNSCVLIYDQTSKEIKIKRDLPISKEIKIKGKNRREILRLCDYFEFLFPWYVSSVKDNKLADWFISQSGNLKYFKDSTEYPLYHCLLKKTVFKEVIFTFDTLVFLRKNEDDTIICFDLCSNDFYSIEDKPIFSETDLSWMNFYLNFKHNKIPQSKIYVCWYKLKMVFFRLKNFFKNHFIKLGRKYVKNILIQMIEQLPCNEVDKTFLLAIIRNHF